jgi:hypothetical protein
MPACRNSFLVFILLTFLNTLASTTFGQGCSDAGFCTMGAMKPDQPFNKKIDFKLRSMELSFYRGTTPVSAKIFVATADLNFGINPRNSLQIKIPYLSAEGNLGSTRGISDISLCYTRNIYASERFELNLSLGGKIPTNKSNLTQDGKPLPMYYQTSLGTYDVIAGISLINRNWLIATGIQIPLNQNENKFTWSAWNDYPDPEYIKKHAPANELKRGTDVMLRIERNFRFSRLNFSLGLLPIYRITNDEILVAATNERVKPEGAKGLALSAIGTIGYSFNVRSGVRFLYGTKLVQRDVNPDGLTREIVTTLSFYYRF